MDNQSSPSTRRGPFFFIFLFLIILIVIGGLTLVRQAFMDRFVFGGDEGLKRGYRKFLTVKVNVPEGGSAGTNGARGGNTATDQSHQFDRQNKDQREAYDPDGPAPGMDAPPFSKETLTAAARLLALWSKNVNDQGIWTGALKELEETGFTPSNYFLKIGEGDYAALKPLLEQHKELIDDFLALVSRPDYEVDAMRKPGVCDESGDVPWTNFQTVQTCAKLLRLRAFLLAHEGKFEEAFKTAELCVRAARVSGYSLLISQLIGASVYRVGINTWSEVVGLCDDPVLLRRTLERQNVLRKQCVFIPSNIPVLVLDQLGVIHELRRRGIKVAYQVLTAQQLMAKAAEAQVEYLTRIARPAVARDGIAQDPEMLKKVDYFIGQHQSESEISGGRAYSVKGAFLKFGASFVQPMVFKIRQPNWIEAHSRADVSRAYFDLLRAETARRIFQLEKGVAPVRLADVSPQYLPEVPGDVFTASRIVGDEIVPVSAQITTATQSRATARDEAVLRAPATLREAPEHYYSIGPDRKDDGGVILYDPSNGSISGGDIFLNRQ